MVPLSDRDLVTSRAKADAEMRAVYSFLFEEKFDFSAASTFPHADLLRAVAERDADAFRTQVSNYQKRRVSEGGGWYENDSLILLLLVGCERFGVSAQFLDPILSARERNTNPVPKQVNEVFRALSRKDFGMESPFSFIKLPALQLADRLVLSSESAQKIYRELTQPGLFGSLSPFLQLLALRAFDLVLFARKPKPFENFEALVTALETYQEKASLRQALHLLWALPYKWWFGCISLLIFILSFSFGVGQRASDRRHEASNSRQRPSSLQVMTQTNALTHNLTAVQALARSVYDSRPSDQYWTAVAIQTAPLSVSAPKFSVEASTGAGTFVSSQAWLVHSADGGLMQTLLPVQQGSQSARAFLEAGEPGDSIVFVLITRTPQPLTSDQLASTITLRALD